MPPAPKFPHAFSRIRMVKIPDKRHSKHNANTGRHKGISPKVKIQLHGKAHRSQPCKRRGNAFIANYADILPQNRQSVRQQYFSGKPDGKIPQPLFCLFPRIFPPILRPPAFFITHNRPRRHLREHGKVNCRLPKRRQFTDFPTVNVCLERNHFKQVKTQSQRQHTGSKQSP